MRQPSLSKYLNLDNSIGMSEYLNNECNINNIIQKHHNNEYLDVITSGAIPNNPTELLNSDNLNTLFSHLREQYDYIIIDSAPISLVSDSLLLDNYTDNVLFICKKNLTKVSQINQRTKRLRNKT